MPCHSETRNSASLPRHLNSWPVALFRMPSQLSIHSLHITCQINNQPRLDPASQDNDRRRGSIILLPFLILLACTDRARVVFALVLVLVLDYLWNCIQRRAPRISIEIHDVLGLQPVISRMNTFTDPSATKLCLPFAGNTVFSLWASPVNKTVIPSSLRVIHSTWCLR